MKGCEERKIKRRVLGLKFDKYFEENNKRNKQNNMQRLRKTRGYNQICYCVAIAFQEKNMKTKEKSYKVGLFKSVMSVG